MKLQHFFFLLFSLASFTLSAQRYSKVKIKLDATHTLAQIARLGLEIEHGFHQPDQSFTGEFSEKEIARILAAGFSIETLIHDLKADLMERNSADASTAVRNNPSLLKVKTPANYTYGTMGGYYKYQEMLDILDQMAVQYPKLFKPKAALDPNLTTFEGRPLYWVKISDNPGSDEAGEPEIFFNAAHHGREPNSITQMIFFMWYLLENYDTDPEVKFLVDHTEIYFVPCVNPDGYIYNEITSPNGGGYWRKNRRLNADGTYGVDLNRNYSYKWGLDDYGSSSDPDGETYRGIAPFSEPETQMIRQFSIDHEFVMTFNYHTFSNLLLHGWAYEISQTPDHDAYNKYGEYLTEENVYKSGLCGELLYPVNGGADDWHYGEQTEKNKSISFTPEVGYTFWPAQSDIDLINKEAFYINIKALRLLHNYGIVTPTTQIYGTDLNGTQSFDLQKTGMEAGTLTVTLKPLTSNIASVGPPKVFTLNAMETISDAFDFSLSPTIKENEMFQFEMTMSSAEYSYSQKIDAYFGNTNLRITAHPNPAREFIHFKFGLDFPESQIFDIEVFNAIGQRIGNFPATCNTGTIKISDWPAGIYFYRIRSGRKILTSNRFMVMQ